MKQNLPVHGLIIFLIIFLPYIFLQKDDESNDITTVIKPLGIAPHIQDGYGDGDNQLAQPDDVEILKNGSMLVSDVNNNRLQLFSKNGEYLRSINAQDLNLEGEIIPTGISKDAKEFIYVSCEGSGTVVRLNPDLSFNQFIGRNCEIKDTEYYCPENENCLKSPQGLITSASGDVFIIDMDDSFRRGYEGSIRNFGFKKFKQINENGAINYIYDKDFADTQEITKVMRKSEGMAISESKGILFIAEEKPYEGEFGNTDRFRFVAAFDLNTGKFLEKLYGVEQENGKIISGLFLDSVEGLSVFENFLFALDEKAGTVRIFNIETGESLGSLGQAGKYYCDDHSDCVIDGVNYNEQSISAGTALPHQKNSWENSELASPDGVNAVELLNGEKRLAVVDQWNMRIVFYDLDEILNIYDK